MKSYIYCLSNINFKKTGLSTGTNKKKDTKRHPMLTVFLTLSLILTSIGASADPLWNNGDTDGSSTLNWGQLSSTLDDFYVPGGGWFIESVTASGFFLNNGEEIKDVIVSIWPHDMDNGEPDGDSSFLLEGISYEVVPTGKQYLGYDEIMIDVDFDKHYLYGQRFYWIELKVKNNYGTSDFHFLARQDTLHNPARIRIGSSGGDTYQNDDSTDLSYVLYGDEVKILYTGASDSVKSGSVPKGKDSQFLYLAQGSGQRMSRFEPGLYQIQMVRSRPQLYYFNQLGWEKLDFVADPSRDPLKFHTPLGDDMCKDAPNLIQEYCQSFVACAAHNICN